jgi:hypothetical protein
MVLVMSVTVGAWATVVTFVVAMCRAAASGDHPPSSGGPTGRSLERRAAGETDRRSGQRGGPPPSSKRGLRDAKAFLSRCFRVPAAQPR